MPLISFRLWLFLSCSIVVLTYGRSSSGIYAVSGKRSRVLRPMAPPDSAFHKSARHAGIASPRSSLATPPREFRRTCLLYILFAEKKSRHAGSVIKFLRPPAKPGSVREGGLHLVAQDGAPDGPGGAARHFAFCAFALPRSPSGPTRCQVLCRPPSCGDLTISYRCKPKARSRRNDRKVLSLNPKAT